MKKIILASRSPRRKKLLRQIGLDFEIIASTIDESEVVDSNPQSLVKRLSYLKAKDVAKRNPGIIIAADTVVSLKEEILEKPKNQREAIEMLSNLSGKTHQVFTGITVINEEKVLTDYEKTDVTFRNITAEEIEAYVATGSPMDKAGAYGIQDQGAIFVKKIKGCFYNVMGLSLVKLVEVLDDLGTELNYYG